MYHKCKRISFKILLIVVLFSSCNNAREKGNNKEIVTDKNTLYEYVLQQIQSKLAIATDADGKIDDSLILRFLNPVEEFYYTHDYAPAWSDTGKFLPQINQLFSYLDTAIRDGLYKQDYHYSALQKITSILQHDSAAMKDAVLWARADLMLTDAFMNIISDIRQGRLISDSMAYKNDTTKFNIFFCSNLNRFLKEKNQDTVFRNIQPQNKDYIALRKTIHPFIQTMDTFHYTILKYPYTFENENDSIEYINQLKIRLSESKYITLEKEIDSQKLASAISKYQKDKKLNPDGKISKALIKYLNNTDNEKLKRLLVSVDKYKEFPDSMPQRYIWVNLPSFYLKVIEYDTTTLKSKIVCGKPSTPTPQITSTISDMVIYPTWTVPVSIIKKEMLPGLKKNSAYLEKKGLKLYDKNGAQVDAATINWAKYSNGIPYKIKQGSGDKNALGVMKFNFLNPYDVYLHDTNQRYFFNNSMRALSHGCVRVQNWKELAFFIAQTDSANLSSADSLTYNKDSINNWLSKKLRHKIEVKNNIPLFIRYISCEANDGKLLFYEDIYDEDKKLADRFFAGK
jgi:murein L,D-transpeptidase YcbB/YkuD